MLPVTAYPAVLVKPNMTPNRIDNLIKKYLDKTATNEEILELTNWYRETANQDAEFPEIEDEVYQSMLQQLNQVTKPRHAFMGYKTWLAAASVILALGIGGILYINLNKTPQPQYAEVIKVGGNKAILTLADGSKISLTDAGMGRIASENGTQISQLDKGRVGYQTSAAGTDGKMVYNTIETPVGGQYQVILPDGTKIWLNAMSSIKFPVSFSSAAERVVELTGEAYFDVKHDERQPFKVISGGHVVEDIGTQFNIQAYNGEDNIKTTLVQGAARVIAGNSLKLLKPGYQTQYNGTLALNKANIDKEIAWKKGYFLFEEDSLEDIMKVVSRWYNIKYVFQEESLRNEPYSAITKRFSNISALLGVMQQTGGNVDFKIQGTTIIIARKKAN